MFEQSTLDPHAVALALLINLEDWQMFIPGGLSLKKVEFVEGDSLIPGSDESDGWLVVNDVGIAVVTNFADALALLQALKQACSPDTFAYLEEGIYGAYYLQGWYMVELDEEPELTAPDFVYTEKTFIDGLNPVTVVTVKLEGFGNATVRFVTDILWGTTTISVEVDIPEFVVGTIKVTITEDFSIPMMSGSIDCVLGDGSLLLGAISTEPDIDTIDPLRVFLFLTKALL